MIRSGFQFSRFRFLVLTGTAFIMAASLGGCGYPESANSTNHSALEKQNAGYERISLYDAVAISLQRNLDAPLTPALPPPDSPLLQAWAKINDGLTGLNPDHALRNKTAEQIIAGTRSAYLRAVVAHYLEDRVEQGLDRLQQALEDPSLNAEQLADRDAQIKEIQAAYQPFATAKQDLALLLGLENPNILMLDDLPATALLPENRESLDTLERNALANRGEFELLGMPSGEEMETLRRSAENLLPPSGSAEASDNPDVQWLAFSDQFGGGLSRILTMKLTLQDPQTRDRFDQLRMQAVSTAIIAQVRLAHAQLEKSEQDAARAISDNNTGTLVSSLRADIARHQALIAMNEAQGLLKRSVGVVPVPMQTGRMKLADLSAALRQRDGFTAPLNLVAIQEQVYQQPDLLPAAYQPVDLHKNFPLPQKIAVLEGAETSIFHPFGVNPRTLNISTGQVRALLEAPVIEP